jgi:hypothetical protein
MRLMILLLSLSFAFSLELFPQMANLKSFPRQLEGERLKAWLSEDSYPKTPPVQGWKMVLRSKSHNEGMAEG